MTQEEIKELHHKMHKGVEMMIETLEEAGKEKTSSWEELMNMSDILKDMSEVEKNLINAEKI